LQAIEKCSIIQLNYDSFFLPRCTGTVLVTPVCRPPKSQQVIAMLGIRKPEQVTPIRSGISATVTTLVIDNDTPTSRALHSALAEQGYSVAQARSCEEAIRRILQTPVDMVLLDTEALGFNGMETCRRLHLAVPQASFVVITDADCEEERIHALDTGADYCVAKPFSLPLFVARLQALIRLRRLRAAHAAVSNIGDQESSDPPSEGRAEDKQSIAHMSLRRLRTALREGQISFPSQVPIFSCQSRVDIQWRLAQLYFVRGWDCAQLAMRYRVTPARVRQLLSSWVRRALLVGYIQEIPGADNVRERA
jgi:DNA-binding response OmpR family regulator